MKKSTKHFIIIMLLATLTTGLVATGAIGLYNALAGDSSTSSNQSYTITLNPHGGELSQSSVTLNTGQSFGSLPTPTKTGYTFIGWFSEENYTNKIENTSLFNDITITTLHAKWEVTTYYIYLYSRWDILSPLSYNIESSETFLPNIYQGGRYFEGWYDNENKEGSPVRSVPTGSSGDKTFYAKWSDIRYTIIFNVNGGDYMYPMYYDVNQLVGLASGTRGGYEFLGWYDNEELNGEPITQIFYSYGDRTFWAKWSDPIVYNIEFELYGHGSLDDPIRVYNVESDDIDLPIPSIDSSLNIAWGGWYEDSYFRTDAALKILKGSYGNKKYYGRWIVLGNANAAGQILFQFNVGLASGVFVDWTTYPSVYYDSSTPGLYVGFFPVPTLNKPYYYFVGWSLAKDGEIIQIITKEELAANPQHLEVFANWQVIEERKITLKCRADPTWEGLAFRDEYGIIDLLDSDNKPYNVSAIEGWYTNPDLSGDPVAMDEYIEDGTILYGQYRYYFLLSVDGLTYDEIYDSLPRDVIDQYGFVYKGGRVYQLTIYLNAGDKVFVTGAYRTDGPQAVAPQDGYYQAIYDNHDFKLDLELIDSPSA
jgi:uncharacterized repeat protein (TIGR02543 family)